MEGRTPLRPFWQDGYSTTELGLLGQEQTVTKTLWKTKIHYLHPLT